MRPAARWSLLGGLGLAGALGSFAAEKDWNINVVGDMTELGRKITPPSQERPAYYVPLVVGHREVGEIYAGDKPPPPKEEILRELAKALAQQNYFVAGAGKPEPTLLLLFSWGSLNPVRDPDQPDLGMILNAKEMRALVAGTTTRNAAIVQDGANNRDLEEVRSDMVDERYFVTVVAFDWQAAKEHKKVILWSTKMSVPSRRVTLPEVTSTLIKTGGPFFGRETERAQRLIVPVREGRVEVGTPKVVPPAEKPASATPVKEDR